MNPLDPTVASLRCWVHEDCLEHPDLALACAEGEARCDLMVASDDDRFTQLSFVDPRGVVHHRDGDGYASNGLTGVPGIGAGDGWGCGYYGGREEEYRLYYGTRGGGGSGGDGPEGGEIGGYETCYGWPGSEGGDGLMPEEHQDAWPSHWGTRLAAPFGIW